MEVLRTPDDRFVDLPGYPFEPRYAEVDDGDGGTLRVHYVDEGPADAAAVVFLHGNPSWSYLWRDVIAATVAAGRRAVAVDLVGLGRSDKPDQYEDYSVARHVDWIERVVVGGLDLHDVTLVLHDWGGIIGLRLLHRHPERIARVVLSNTGLPARDPAEPLPDDRSPRGPLVAWQTFAREAQPFEPWVSIRDGGVLPMRDEVMAAYAAPFPEDRYTIGARAFAQLLPTRPDDPQLPDNWEAWQTLTRFERPFLTIYSDKDIVAPTGYRPFVERVPGAHGQPHVILEGGGHFLQEDVGPAYTEHLLAWLDATD